ncbi:YlbL family protein [Gephyromycinifex aptenodytis]|uniref:YlbL family protein n=1 Tax=Gephyromycinifex aptenodytis TaxID=2716227 RepID=UPI0014465FF5|nr:PDZ domain-containing protein [Gephyromycinifex aptenodytis]
MESGRTVLTIVLVGALLALLGQVISVPYVVYRAGPAIDVLGRDGADTPTIGVKGAKTYPTTGSLYMTTVSQSGGPGRPLSVWDFLAAKLDPEAEIVPKSDVFPDDVTQKQVEEQNTAAMAGSQDDAVAVALRELGRPVREKVTVAAVDPNMPAAGRLEKNDIITAVDGSPVATRKEVTDLVQKAAVGAPVRVSVLRGGKARVVQVTPTTMDGRRLMGVAVSSTFSFDVDVDIRAGHIGGPSAGMMFALGVYDRLTPGALTGGTKIAGTGAITPEGEVLPIGGIVHKMQGAVETSATHWFLAPAQNCAEAAAHTPEGLRVVRVADFEDARKAVESIAAGKGDSLPRCAG